MNFFQWILFTTTTLGASSIAASLPRHLPDCAFRSPEPCQCPEKTVFQNTTSTLTFGANAKDVAAILYAFFHVPWISVDPVETSGEDLVVGSTRTMPLAGLLFVEQVLESWIQPNGTFGLVISQKDVPLVLENENGTYYFSGYWDENRISYVNETHTDIWWHAHGCITVPAGFDDFQMTAINNTFKYLEERGQILADSTVPQTIVYPPEFAGGWPF